jgi:hypothetical protein
MDGSSMDVPYLSLTINEVPPAIRNEAQGAKNKIFKPRGREGGRGKNVLNPKYYNFML